LADRLLFRLINVGSMVKVNLNDDKTEQFLTSGRPKLLRLAVATQSGGRCIPHISAIWYLWKEGHIWLTTSEDRLKVKAIRENPRVAIIIDTDIIPYEGVIVEGIAELTKERVEDITLEITRKYVPQEFVESEFKDLMRYPRVLIKIRPLKSIDIMSYKTL